MFKMRLSLLGSIIDLVRLYPRVEKNNHKDTSRRCRPQSCNSNEIFRGSTQHFASLVIFVKKKHRHLVLVEMRGA